MGRDVCVVHLPLDVRQLAILLGDRIGFVVLDPYNINRGSRMPNQFWKGTAKIS